jgi:hypothetical protein
LLCCYARSEYSTSFTSQFYEARKILSLTVSSLWLHSDRGECRLRLCTLSSLANAAQLRPPSPGMLCLRYTWSWCLKCGLRSAHWLTGSHTSLPTLDRAAFPLAAPHPTHQLDHHFSHTACQPYQAYQPYRPSHPGATSPTHSLTISCRLYSEVGMVGISVVAKSYDLSRVDRFGPTWKSSRSLLGSDLVRIVLRCVQKSEREFKDYL